MQQSRQWLDRMQQAFMIATETCDVLGRRHKQRRAVYEADDGHMPPLYSKIDSTMADSFAWGTLYGTEHLDPSGLRKWKATAVGCPAVCLQFIATCDALTPCGVLLGTSASKIVLGLKQQALASLQAILAKFCSVNHGL